ncbi:hypothetical protein [Cypionkella sp. TWP1-2-1b2]|uniref:hypothetical protein n=1 Tax=Cypionkella sp. TWP1-2-1b2 TaxID=2804675 RepID=UPI003CF5DF3C
MRDDLGDGYTESNGKAFPKVPDSADFVIFWWKTAALATRAGKTRRFGFITINSLRQTFNRQVLAAHLSDPKTPLTLAFVSADHPWVDAGDGAAVRIAMIAATPGTAPGRLFTVTDEGRAKMRTRVAPSNSPAKSVRYSGICGSEPMLPPPGR